MSSIYSNDLPSSFDCQDLSNEGNGDLNNQSLTDSLPMSFVPPELSVLEGNPSLDYSVTNSFEGNKVAVTSDNYISESDLDNNYSFSSTSSDESDDIRLEEKTF